MQFVVKDVPYNGFQIYTSLFDGAYTSAYTYCEYIAFPVNKSTLKVLLIMGRSWS